MILNFCLFKYFPYGGMQRDCLRLAKACYDANYEVNIYVIKWHGIKPEGINVLEFPQKNFHNYKKYQNFNTQVLEYINKKFSKSGIKSLNIGFNKMQGLDIYYAADGCFITKNQKRSWIHRITGRYRYFKKMEYAVFGNANDDNIKNTNILFLIDKQKQVYQDYYKTDNNRLNIMPPVIESIDFIRELNEIISVNGSKYKNDYKEKLFQKLNIDCPKYLFLLIGSGFKTKGLDRILYGLSYLKQQGLSNFRLLVIGNDKASSFTALINKLKLGNNITFTGGRSDIIELMHIADLLLHPAYNENTGKVIIEALASGLPVICSDSCGFAKYVTNSDGGIVINNFTQDKFNANLYELIIDANKRSHFSRNGIKYGTNFQKDSDANKLLEVINNFK
tara:strand:+ start:8923 stop:10098 length:1176 start_codon:yes stop_codon:yes gene_type:complete